MTTTFSDLPEDVLVHMLDYLHSFHVVDFATVSRFCYQVSEKAHNIKIKTNWGDVACAGCGQEAPKLWCSGCRFAKWCSPECKVV